MTFTTKYAIGDVVLGRRPHDAKATWIRIDAIQIRTLDSGRLTLIEYREKRRPWFAEKYLTYVASGITAGESR